MTQPTTQAASAQQPPVQPPPTVRATAAPPVRIVTPAAEETPAPPKQVAHAAPPKVVVPKSPPPTPVAAPQTTGTSGYVAVLSSQKSRMDALKAYADLQLKYGDVLTSRTPDVQEADLSARGLGTMYRLVVGPPGSRDAAAGVCSQLKTAGYTGCWVMAY
jgi:cell division septation protein DedD